MFTIAAFGFVVENGSRCNGAAWPSGTVLSSDSEHTDVSSPLVMLRETPHEGPANQYSRAD